MLPPPPPSLPSPEEFRPEKFQKKSGARDYVIYAIVSVIVLGVIGGSAYYFTRSKAEQDELRAKLDKTLNEAGLAAAKEPTPLPKLKSPKLDGILDGEGIELDVNATAVAVKKPEPKPVAVSTYAGGGASRVALSDDAKLPKASVAFIQFAETLRVSSVVQTTPAKIMIEGKLFRAGEMIDDVLGVTFVGVDGARTALILRDKRGAELRLSY